jgi:hypothetical protein
MPTEYITLTISGVGCVVWYLLRTKDEAQGKAIELLFSKHDADYAELQALKLQIASQHYVKGELDHKFDKLEGAFRDGFTSLGTKFDRLGDVLVEHIQQETIGR